MDPVPLRKLLSSSEIATLLEDLAKITPVAVRLWVVGAEGDLIACYPQEDEGIEKAFAPIIERVHQVTKAIHFPQGIALPIVVEGRLLGVLVGEGSGSELSVPNASFEHLGRMLALLAAKELEKRGIAQETLESHREMNLLYTLGETVGAYLDLGEINRLVLQESGRIIRADKGAIMLVDEATGRLMVKASYGLDDGFREEPLGQAVAEKVVRSGKAQIVNDPRREIGPLRSLLCAPLKTKDKILGVISLADKKSGQIFTAADEKLLATLAAQAAIAIENACLYEMTAQALTQRVEELTTTAEIVHELAAASLDLERAIDLVLDRAMQAIGADYGLLALHDEEKGGLLLLSQRGYPPGALEPYRYEPWPVEQGIVGRVVKTGTVALVPDVSQDPDYNEVVEQARSQLAVPIIREGEVVGVVSLESSELAGFSERDAGFVSHLAGHAAIAIENARLYENVTEKMREAMVLHRVSTKLMRTLNVDQLLEEILEVLERFFGYLGCAVLLVDEASEELYIRASRGYAQEVVERTRIKIGEEGITGWVAAHKVPLNVPDVAEDPRYIEGVKGTQSEIAVPMLSGEKMIGVLDAQSPKVNAFNDDDLRVLSSVAAQAAIAIERAQLYSAERRRLQESSTLLAIAQALSSTLDLTEVLKLMACSTAQACHANRCSILLLSQDRKELVPIMSLFASGEADRELWATFKERYAEAVDEFPILQEVIKERKPVILDSTAMSVIPQKWVEPFGIVSLLMVPLISKDEVIGLMALDHVEEGQRFTDEQVNLAITISTHATMVIENARLFEQIAEGRDKLQAILNSTRDGILMFDITGQIVMANPMIEQLWDLDRAKVIGLDLTQLVEEDPDGLLARLGYRHEEMRDLLRQLCQGEQNVSKAIHEIATPSRRFIERVASPVLDEQGKVIGQVIVLHDITEEKELEKMREDLTHMIVHDLRSPLTGIIGGLHLLRAAVENPSSRVEMLLGIATSSSQRMLELVNSLLDISQLEAGQMQLEIKPRSLPDLVDGACERVAPLALEDDITLQVDLSPDLPQVAVDADLVTRVLINLLDNAIKFSPQGGVVRVTADGVSAIPTPEEGSGIISQQYISVSVTDTGPGIPEEYQEKIFEKFSQIGEQESRRGRGSGLGLTFCRLVVKAHGGRIWVESQMGQGSTFTFTLPVAETESINADE
jgi:NtrC-family two-component system sensor histidine kinase KinB